MLSWFRKNNSSWFVRGILGLIALVFVFFGVGTFDSYQINTVAKVNKQLIKLVEYRQLYQSQASSATTAEQEDQLRNQVLESLVGRKLWLGFSEELGIYTTDEEIFAQLQQNLNFQTDKRFDIRKYEQYLENNRLTKLEYEELISSELTLNKLGQFFDQNSSFSQKVAAAEWKLSQTKAEAQILWLKPELFKEQVAVTPALVEEYYLNHPTEFQSVPKVNFAGFVLTAEDVDIKIRDKEISNYYQKNLEQEFTYPARFKARHILIALNADQSLEEGQQALRLAQQVSGQLQQNPARFEALAQQYSTDNYSKVRGGDLGWLEYESLVPELVKPLQALEINQISKPLLSQFGYHIMQISERQPARTDDLETVQLTIQQKITARKAAQKLQALASNIQNELEQAELAELAQQYSKQLRRVEELGPETTLLWLNPEYSVLAYQYLINQTAGSQQIYALDEQTYLVYLLDAASPPTTLPLDEVRQTVEQKVRQQLLMDKTQEQFMAYQAAQLTQADWPEIVNQLNAQQMAYQITFIRANRVLPDIGYAPELGQQIFALETSSNVQTVEVNGNYYLVIKLSEEEPNVLDHEAQIQNYLQQLSQSKNQYIIAKAFENLRLNADIEFNQTQLDALGITI